MTFNKADIVRQYIDRFGDMPNQTLAKKLNADLPEIFPTVNDARGIVRWVVGSMGPKSRRYTEKEYMKPENLKKYFEFVDGEKNDVTPYEIPGNINKLGVISDTQIPFHDKDAIITAYEHFDRKGVDGILLNGDIWDAYRISKYEQDPRQRTFAYELDLTRQFLKELRGYFKDIDIYFKEGNHEERWEKYLMNYAPILLETNEYNLDIILQLRPLGIHWITNKRTIQFGKLNFIHGHEYKGGGMNPARWLFLRTKDNTVCGHFHKLDSFSGRKIGGDPIQCWTMGCLCDLNPKYLPNNEWALGWGYTERLDETGLFRFHNLRYENYRIKKL